MDGSALAILIGLAVLVALGLLLGHVIGWFGFRRHGWDVDYQALGLGFVCAGAIALLIILVTDGPWVVGLVVTCVGVGYLIRARMDRSRQR